MSTSQQTRRPRAGSSVTTTGRAVPDAAAGQARAAYLGEPNLADESRAGRVRRQVRELVVAADYRMKRRVRHPDGGHRTVEHVLRDEVRQRDLIEAETRLGSRKHQRVAAWIGWIPKLVFCMDFCQLLYFMSGVTNVNWAEPMTASLALAVVLAAMITATSFGFLAFAGDRLRGFKNHAGTVDRADIDGVTRAALVLAVIVVMAVATLMFVRMRTEVLYALGPRAAGVALVIAGTLAVVNVVANFLVVAVHALNGSDQVARLNSLARTARRSVRQAVRMRERAARRAAVGEEISSARWTVDNPPEGN